MSNWGRPDEGAWDEGRGGGGHGSDRGDCELHVCSSDGGCGEEVIKWESQMKYLLR